MADYSAPARELRFVLHELLKLDQLQTLPAFEDASDELVDAVIEEAGRFAADIFAPLNRSADAAGVSLEAGEVQLPDGFAEAYQLFVDNGWLSLAQDPEYGGQGLPFTVHASACEMWHSACTSLALSPLLTAGAIDALQEHASDQLKSLYLPKLISGEWTATMNLTESHAGSDLSNLKTRAEPEGDHYLLRGQKIFITWGDHSMTENIAHIVLAPMSDAQPGVKGLSLFLVPKFLVNEDGSLGDRNDVKAVSLEHKLGIHGSPTCVMSYGEESGAIGYLIGQPGDGLACMFTLMNHARLEVGIQGVALAERAYQDAVAYARERVQGADPETGQRIPIIGHADVQRMLMLMRSLTEAMRALAYDGSLSHDLRIHGATAEDRKHYEERFALLTPIVKAWCTDLVNEVTSMAVQVHGGMGFIEETGVAQHYRDARIAAIYEGTNGIQANDLVGRKIIRDQGAGLRSLLKDISATVVSLDSSDSGLLKSLAAPLSQAAEDLEACARFLIDGASDNPRLPGAVAHNFLMMMGYVCGAWYMARSAVVAATQIAEGSDDSFYHRKLQAAQFYSTQMLPRYLSHRVAVEQGAEIGMALTAESF